MSFRLHRFPLRPCRKFYVPLSLPLTFALGSGAANVVFAQDNSVPASGTVSPVAGQGAGGEQPAGVRVRNFVRLKWSPETNSLKSEGHVKIDYTDPNDHIVTNLEAEDLDYDANTGDVNARGRVTVTRPDGTFAGDKVHYNLINNAGTVANANVQSPYFRMNGELIERKPDGTYELTNGEFTTCTANNPDYRFRVKKLTIDPTRFLRARRVRMFLGNFALPELPAFNRRLDSRTGFPFPIPGYDKEDGVTLRVQDSPIDAINETLDFDLRFTFRRAPTGFIAFQHDLGFTPFRARPPRLLLPTLADPLSGVLELVTPPTYREYSENHYNEVSEPRTVLYATIQNQQFVYNRRRSDLNISRFPDVGVQFLNILGKPIPLNINGEATDDPQDIGIGAAARRATPNAPALLNVTASAAEILENPTKVSAARLAVRANLVSQPVLLGKRLSLRFGVSHFLNLYSTGSLYTILSPEAELDFIPTRTSLFNVGYRYLTDAGRTPFAFDHADIRHELRLQYQVSGPWAFGTVTKIDLERSRIFDSEFAIVRNFDCMQVGLVYRVRSQSINILFNLFPPRRDRSRLMVPLKGHQ